MFDALDFQSLAAGVGHAAVRAAPSRVGLLGPWWKVSRDAVPSLASGVGHAAVFAAPASLSVGVSWFPWAYE
jgi:hypothetical protein